MNYPRSFKILVPALVLGAVAFGLAGTRSALAQSRPAITPAPGQWCGITAKKEPMRMSISPDSRFVEWITVAGAASRASNYLGTGIAQVADSRFIFRQKSDDRACQRGRDSRNQCGAQLSSDVMIRGTFGTPNLANGSFSARYSYTPDPNDRHNRERPWTSSSVGTYTAWPVGFAPCP